MVTVGKSIRFTEFIFSIYYTKMNDRICTLFQQIAIILVLVFDWKNDLQMPNFYFVRTIWKLFEKNDSIN
jgi:hypothetical protein